MTSPNQHGPNSCEASRAEYTETTSQFHISLLVLRVSPLQNWTDPCLDLNLTMTCAADLDQNLSRAHTWCAVKYRFALLFTRSRPHPQQGDLWAVQILAVQLYILERPDDLAFQCVDVQCTGKKDERQRGREKEKEMKEKTGEKSWSSRLRE